MPISMPASLGSGASVALMKFFACFSVICGGSGGTSGSVLTSSTTGRSDASASSQAAASWSGIVDEDAAQPDQLGEAMIRHVGDLLRGVEFRVALHHPLLPGDLVQVLVVEHADHPVRDWPIRASISRR